MTAAIRIIAVGFGGIGTQDHQNSMYLPALAAHPGYELLGVVDVGAATGALEAANRYGVRAFSDLASALTTPGLQAVCVTAPFGNRVAACNAALAAGVHVLIDKPIAATSIDAIRLASAAEEAGVVLMPAHHQRMDGGVRAASDAVADGAVGTITSIAVEFLVAGGDLAPCGELLNLGLYPIDIVQWLLGAPADEVFATAPVAPEDATASDDLALLALHHTNGAHSTVLTGRMAPKVGVRAGGLAIHRYHICGTAGSLVVDALALTLQARLPRVGDSSSLVGVDTVTALLDAFCDAVWSGAPHLSGLDAVNVLATIEAAQDSLRTGCAVSVRGVGSELIR